MARKVICGFAAIILSCLAIACTDDAISGPGFRCDVTNPVESLTLTPSSSVVFVHAPARASDVLQLTATATNRVGNIRTDVPISFVSSDSSVATVDSHGVVHALKPGSTRITASTCGEKATADITVSLLTVSVKISLDTAAILAGDSVLAKASAIGQDGSAISGAKFTFTASPGTGITIVQRTDSTATVKASSAGSFTITASGEGASASAALTVAPRIFIGAAAASNGGLDLGRDFGCGLIPLGRLYCWGVNGLSQLASATDSLCYEEQKGLEVTNPCSLLPIRVGPTSLVFTSVSAGDRFACGITSGGAAYCWGDGQYGKLGNGRNGGASTAGLVTSALSFSSISAGGEHACGLTPSGAAYCWGQDSLGQLGDARHVSSTTPIPVSGGSGVAVFASISAGFRHTCALQADGTAFCWGRGDDGELGIGGLGRTDTPGGVVGGLRFTSISAGGDTLQVITQTGVVIIVDPHTCAIAVGGAAYCWGSNRFGQLGNGSIGGQFSAPTPVAGGLSFSKISAGSHHTCGLTTGGAVYCWGRGSDLQLGQGITTGGGFDSGTPQQVVGGELPAGVTFTTISAGTRHSCAVGSDGNAYCWGSNVFGALGNTLQAAFRGLPQRVATPH
jgi:alpha-tubulin suppressor-like RCC1 family protein